MKGANATYFGNILEAASSTFAGLKLTVKHLFQALNKRKPVGIKDDNYFSRQSGIVTLQYPHESFPVPDNGRYRLYNEIDDCIVCDLCAKICPVNCIEIEPVKATEEIGKTSDGTTKRIYAAKFDIDMAKCCYCGLCTTVCPTECLTMTKAYDYSEFDVRNMVYHFTDLTPEQAAEKQRLLEESQKAKVKTPTAHPEVAVESKNDLPLEKKPVFKPTIKPPVPKTKPEENEKVDAVEPPKNKPVFKPVIKLPIPADEKKIESEDKAPTPENSQVASNNQKNELENSASGQSEQKRPITKPVFKPVIKSSTIKKLLPEQDQTLDQPKKEVAKDLSKEGNDNIGKGAPDKFSEKDAASPTEQVNKPDAQKTPSNTEGDLTAATKKIKPFNPVIKKFNKNNSSDQENPDSNSPA